MSDLASTQRRLWRLLTAPEGVRAALADEGDPDATSLRGFVRDDARLSAALRLEVYANAYFHRVKDALADDYGALASRLGSAAFHDLATAYLLAHPPSHPSLRFAGERLPAFVAHHAAATPFRRRWPWAADLAHLEWALVDAFDAPDAARLTRAALAGRPADRWADLPLGLVPSARLLEVAWEVHRVREAWEADGSAPIGPPAPRASCILVWRRLERVWFRALGPDEADCLERVRSGTRFGAFCAWLAGRDGENAAPGRAAALLARWIEDGLLRAEPRTAPRGVDRHDEPPR